MSSLYCECSAEEDADLIIARATTTSGFEAMTDFTPAPAPALVTTHPSVRFTPS
jgi:hypothetical protein